MRHPFLFCSAILILILSTSACFARKKVSIELRIAKQATLQVEDLDALTSIEHQFSRHRLRITSLINQVPPDSSEVIWEFECQLVDGKVSSVKALSPIDSSYLETASKIASMLASTHLPSNTEITYAIIRVHAIEKAAMHYTQALTVGSAAGLCVFLLLALLFFNG